MLVRFDLPKPSRPRRNSQGRNQFNDFTGRVQNRPESDRTLLNLQVCLAVWFWPRMTRHFSAISKSFCNGRDTEVLPASDGLEAMRLLMSRPVDVVVTDALMPNLNGYELCRFVRSSPRLSGLPIVLLSALDPKNAEAEQVDAFLTKPVSPEDLLECLSRVMVAE